MLTGKVRMIEHIIAQAVCGNGIVDIVALVCIPVLRKFFGAENKHRFVAVLVILDDGKRSECLAETNTVSQNAAVEFLKLADDGKNCIALEVIEHSPDFAFLETCCLIRQFVFGNVIKKLLENVIERNKVDVFRGVLTICSGNILDYDVSDFL